jgi:hypothetical protein
MERALEFEVVDLDHSLAVAGARGRLIAAGDWTRWTRFLVLYHGRPGAKYSDQFDYIRIRHHLCVVRVAKKMTTCRVLSPDPRMKMSTFKPDELFASDDEYIEQTYQSFLLS